jgi:tripartite ATP-independent transporter DctP family solute receptor
MKRRTALSSGLATLGGLALPRLAAAQHPTVIKAGHGGQTGHPTHGAMLRMSEMLRDRTGGQVRMDVFPDRQLGEERELVEGLQLGTVDMCAVSTGPLVSFVPQVGVLDLPFLFQDSAHAYRVLDGEIGRDILARFAGRGIQGLAYWENGWRHLTSRNPVSTPADMRGMKLRTMQNPVHIQAFRNLGAAPVPMVWGEVFTSLGQGVIDGQENPLGVIALNSLWEVQRHVALTRHLYGPHLVLFSKARWDRLPATAREAITGMMPEVTAWQRAEVTRIDAEAANTLRARGMTVSEVDIRPFQAAVQQTYAQFRDRFDPALVARIQAAAAQ